MSYVKRYGYRAYTGEFRGRLYRVWSIVLFHGRRSITRSTLTKLITGIYLFFLITFHMGFVWQAQAADDFEESYLLAVRYLVENPFLTLILIIYVGLIGSPLFADDLLYESIDTYRSRVSAVEYLTGKFLALFLLTSVLILVPVIVDYFFLGFVLGGDVVDRLLLNSDHVELLAQASFIAILTCLYLNSIILALSSATKQRGHVSAAFVIGTLAMTALVTLAAALSEEPRVLFFSPLLLILFIASYTFDPNWGKDQTSFVFDGSNPLADVTALEVYAFTGMIILLCWLIIYYFLWYRRE
ncbi:MAG: hypothetical protein ACXACI_09040 [Candidatus Hodarchaeales archaeon]|jgi:hypothetical protein